MITIENYAPNADAITLLDDDYNISITRSDDGKVHIAIQEEGRYYGEKSNVRHLILGRKKIDKWPGIDKINKKRYRAKEEGDE